MAGKIPIVVVCGTVRPGNYTGKAVAIVVDELRRNEELQVRVIDPAPLHLPFPGVDPDAPGTRELQDVVSQAAGVILATPEYHGSFSSVTKLVIENLGFPSVLAGKPVGLVGVAAGAIGAIKSLEQLRGVCSHIGAVVLPLATSVANVQSVFDSEGKCLDEGVEKRLRGAATQLVEYLRHYVCPAITLEAILRGRA